MEDFVLPVGLVVGLIVIGLVVGLIVVVIVRLALAFPGEAVRAIAVVNEEIAEALIEALGGDIRELLPFAHIAKGFFALAFHNIAVALVAILSE